MEKDVAVREWCIEQAMELAGEETTAKKIVAEAKVIEDYILHQSQEARKGE